ncbi:MAG: glycosyltransferase family A protein [Chloroflexota bacterium]
MTPTFSVIVPCYNHANYLGDALESILSQTFQSWEAIIIDDGSKDRTAEIADLFAKRDNRIRYVYQDNQGLAAARNTGIRAANGELIALLDADDKYTLHFLEKSLAAIKSNERIGAVYSGFQFMSKEGEPFRNSVVKVLPPESFHDAVLKDNWLSPCSVVTFRCNYLDTGLFDETLRACEDADMWIRLSKKYLFVGIPDVLVWVRRMGTNMTDDTDRMVKARFAVCEKHLGTSSGSPAEWSPLKRDAYTTIHISGVYGYLAQGRFADSAKHLKWLLEFSPHLAQSLDIWYSMACAHQVFGQWGEFSTWDADRAQHDLSGILGSLANNEEDFQTNILAGQAHLAMALLSYGKGDLERSRKYYKQGIRFWPRSIVSKKVMNLGIRLLPGIQTISRYLKIQH